MKFEDIKESQISELQKTNAIALTVAKVVKSVER